MSRLYRNHVREQEVYCGKSAEALMADVSRETCNCKNIQDLYFWCDKCLETELNIQEDYFLNGES